MYRNAMESCVLKELVLHTKPAFTCTQTCCLWRICACLYFTVCCLNWWPKEGNHAINQPSIKSAVESVKSACHLSTELLVAGARCRRISFPLPDFLCKCSLLKRKTWLAPKRHVVWFLMKHVSSTWWNIKLQPKKITPQFSQREKNEPINSTKRWIYVRWATQVCEIDVWFH